jgi:hypothetical protein
MLDVSKLAGLKMKPEKTKSCMLMSHYWKTGQKYSINVASKVLEDMATFNHLRTTLTHQNCMQKEIDSILSSEKCLLLFGPESFCRPVCCPGM